MLGSTRIQAPHTLVLDPKLQPSCWQVLQAVHRGRLARRQMQQQAAPLLQPGAEPSASELSPVSAEQLAEFARPDNVQRIIKMQAVQRGRIARRQRKQEEQQVVAIQAAIRGRLARKQVAAMKADS